MIKTILRRTVSVSFVVGKVTTIGVGLAVMVALALGVGTTALAAVPGDPLKLGQLNTINTLTRLIGNKTGALLLVRNDGGPALTLQVGAGHAPLTVNAGAGTALNLSADRLDGLDYSAFSGAARVFDKNFAPSTGTALGDGTYQLEWSCPSGTKLLSGGPADIDPGTRVLESFPANTYTWRTRIQNDGSLDAFTTVVLCATYNG